MRLGVDVGRARVGVARSDPDGLLAMPVQTLPRDDATVPALSRLATEYEAIEIVVGLPRSLRGGDTASTEDAREFAALLAACGVPVRLFDERLSTVSAQRSLREVGRNSRSQRAMIDQAAAMNILQDALDAERSTGRAPGEPIGGGEQR